MFVCVVCPRSAAADWLVTPFFGAKFDGQTSLFDNNGGAKKSTMVAGGAVMLLGDAPLGLEADFGYLPSVFGSKSGVLDSSRALTFTGNIIVAAPTAVTRESLRPFVVGGLGWMNAHVQGVAGLLESRMNELAFDVGGGAIGALSRRTSVRFELRRFQNITEHDAGLRTGTIGRTKLRFWRADVGLAFKF